MFDSLDRDDDNMIKKDEFVKGLAAEGVAPPEAEALFNHMDETHTGKLGIAKARERRRRRKQRTRRKEEGGGKRGTKTSSAAADGRTNERTKGTARARRDAVSSSSRQSGSAA